MWRLPRSALLALRHCDQKLSAIVIVMAEEIDHLHRLDPLPIGWSYRDILQLMASRADKRDCCRAPAVARVVPINDMPVPPTNFTVLACWAGLIMIVHTAFAAR
jgi:hypothetical protein